MIITSQEQRKKNNYFILIDSLPDRIYKKAICPIEDFKLKKFIGLDIRVVSDLRSIRFIRDYKVSIKEQVKLDYDTIKKFPTFEPYTIREEIKSIAISINIPYYEKVHAEKIIPSKYNFFRVFEYTKIKSYTTKEIDWNRLKQDFNKYLLKICIMSI